MDSSFALDLFRHIEGKAKPICIQEPGSSHYYLLNSSGNYELKQPQEGHRKHVFASVESLVLFAMRWGYPTIWVSEKEIVCTPCDGPVPNNTDLRHRATLPLGLSTAMQTLIKWNVKTPISIKELVWTLRTTFGASDIHPADLLHMLRTLRFKRSEEGTSVTSQGKSSIGKQINAELNSGERPFPDWFTVSVPILNPPAPGISHPVNVQMDVDPTAEIISVQTQPYRIKEVIAETLKKIKVLIEEEIEERQTVDDPEDSDYVSVKVYLGSPD